MRPIHELRLAARSLIRSPGYAIAVVLTLGLGIGANTAVFSVVRGVLLRPLPHRDGHSLVYLRQSAELAGQDNVLFSVPEIIDYRTASKTLTGFAEFSQMEFTMIGPGDPVRINAGVVSGNYFDVLGLAPVVGRVFDAGDDGPAAEPVMVLSHEYWMRMFGGDPGIVGTTVRVNNRSSTIVGVLQPAPHYPTETDVFVNMVTSPHHLSATMVQGRTHRMTEVFARLAPGATVQQARQELDQIAARVHADYPESYEQAAGYRISVSPLQDALTARARVTLYLLMGTAAFVLLIACANVANLTMIRSIRRERELAVRWALGARPWRLRGLVLAESLLLALAGAGVGLALAYGGLDLLVAFAQRFTPRAAEVAVDGGVLAFTLVVATLAAVAFAFAPPLPAIASAGSQLSAGVQRVLGGRARQRVQRGLVVAQVAVSIMVLTGAGLLARTLAKLYEVDAGLDIENVLTMNVPLEGAGRTAAERLALYEEMRRRIAALPGVIEVGLGSTVPLTGESFVLEIKADGLTPAPGEPTPRAEYRTASPEFFRAAGIPLLRGRTFEATDGPDAGRVVVLNRTLAERIFGDRDPIGWRVAWTGDVLRFIPVSGDWRTVVGVVGDTRDSGLDEEPRPIMYQPFAQEVFTGALLIRASVDAATLAPAATRIIRELVPQQPIEDVRTLEQIREESVAPRRLNALLVGTFGALALLIAAVGIAGVLAFSVSLRTAEIGVRMSLGADPVRVLRMVLAEGGTLLAGGIAIGLAGALVGARLLAGLLFGVPPHDPVTLAGVFLLMTAVGVLACSVPAVRAARVNPIEAMRTE